MTSLTRRKMASKFKHYKCSILPIIHYRSNQNVILLILEVYVIYTVNSGEGIYLEPFLIIIFIECFIYICECDKSYLILFTISTKKLYPTK